MNHVSNPLVADTICPLSGRQNVLLDGARTSFKQLTGYRKESTCRGAALQKRDPLEWEELQKRDMSRLTHVDLRFTVAAEALDLKETMIRLQRLSLRL
jgi:hypothetical protein